MNHVNQSDSNFQIIQKEIDKITTIDGPVGNKITIVKKIEGQAVKKIFPNWNFYKLKYTNIRGKGFDECRDCLAVELGYTVAIPTDDSKIIRLYHYGDFKDYQDLLQKSRSTLQSAIDAKLIWLAFCEIHGFQWEEFESKKISKEEWRLGIYCYDQTISVDDKTKTIDRICHYYKVLIYPTTKEIKLWECIVETSNKRIELAK